MSYPFVGPQRAASVIRVIRGQNVLLDADLAALYLVDTRTLNQSVQRNLDRFPPDFMFRLTEEEFASLRSQIVILDGPTRGVHRKYLPYAFTEQGVAMLSGILRSPRAVQANIEIMRAFVRMRHLVESNAELARKVAALEKRYDGQFRAVFDAIRELMAPPAKGKPRIGF